MHVSLTYSNLCITSRKKIQAEVVSSQASSYFQGYWNSTCFAFRDLFSDTTHQYRSKMELEVHRIARCMHSIFI